MSVISKGNTPTKPCKQAYRASQRAANTPAKYCVHACPSGHQGPLVPRASLPISDAFAAHKDPLLHPG